MKLLFFAAFVLLVSCHLSSDASNQEIEQRPQKKWFRSTLRSIKKKIKNILPKCKGDGKRKAGQSCGIRCGCAKDHYCYGFKCYKKPSETKTRACSVEKLSGYFAKETYYSSYRTTSSKDGFKVSTVDVAKPTKGVGVSGCRSSKWTVYNYNKGCNLVDINHNRRKRLTIVAFQGTRGKNACDHWSNTKNVFSTVSLPGFRRGSVGRGFRDELKAVRSKVCNKLGSLVRHSSRIVFTGHSQGGGLAEIAPYYFAKNCHALKRHARKLSFISFVAPKSATKTFWQHNLKLIDYRSSITYDSTAKCLMKWRGDFLAQHPAWLNHPPVSKRYIKCLSNDLSCSCHNQLFMKALMWKNT